MFKKQQKLSAKLKNTPRNTSLVPCSVNSVLNKEETLSVQNKVLTDNNLEENQLQKKRQNLRVSVYVLNKRGQPLMPTTPRKARVLLKEGKAKVIERMPFTIQLNYTTGETKQPITLGVDAGYSNIGFSAISEKRELIAGEVKLRNDIVKKLMGKKQYRKARRYRLWYRKSRFLNRMSSKKRRMVNTKYST